MKLILVIGALCILYFWILPKLSDQNVIVVLSLWYEENSLGFFVSTVSVAFICSLFSKKIIHNYLDTLFSITLVFLAFHEFIATPYVQQKYTQQMNKLEEDTIPGLVLTNIKKDRTSLNKEGVPAEHLVKKYKKLLKYSKNKLTAGSSEEQKQKKRALATLYILSQDDDQKTQGLSLLISLSQDNDCKSKMLLGFFYYQGQGVTQDYVMAHVWYELACRRKFQDACGVRDKLATIMPSEDIQKAQNIADKKDKEMSLPEKEHIGSIH